MPLSEWPDHFQDKPEPRGKIVECVFEEEMFVKLKLDKSIGLTDTPGRNDRYTLWIPISQIDGEVPSEGDWIESIRIPKWLAEEKGLMV